jgi:predicted patatin/cPLA2 family phospholipase
VHKIQRFAVTALAVVALTGCGARVDYISVPELDVENARVGGYGFIRFWGDEAPEKLKDVLVEKTQQSKARFESKKKKSRDGKLRLSFISISGGGANGAFGAGLLNGWTQKGDRPEFEGVTGISTGALSAPYAFLGSAYDARLKEVYTTIMTKNILIAKGIAGILGGTAAADSSPLYQLISKHVTAGLLVKIAAEHQKGRRLWIGTTNLEAGRPVIWDMGAIASSGNPNALNLFRKIMLASASIPGAFPPVTINVNVQGVNYQEIHVDGGTTNQAFIYPGQLSVKNSRRGAVVKAERRIYIIRNGKVRPEWKKVKGQTLSIAERAVDTLLTSQGDSDMYKIFAITKRDGFDFNLTYIPLDFDFPSNELFDKTYMNALFDLAYAEGVKGIRWRKNPYGF